MEQLSRSDMGAIQGGLGPILGVLLAEGAYALFAGLAAGTVAGGATYLIGSWMIRPENWPYPGR